MNKRLFKLVGCRVPPAVACTAWMLCTMPLAPAAPRTWIGGNVDWVDAGAATNWNPNDEPDADDQAIFNTANTVNLGSNNAVNGLALSGGIDLFTSDFDLTVDGLAEIAGAGSNLFVGGAGSELNADNITVNASGTLELRGGSLTLDDEVGIGILDINAGGTVQGNGTITLTDSPGGATALFINDGTLTVMSRGLTILSPPPVGTLEITDTTPNPRIDLDGTGENGVVNINRNQTLILQNIGLADNFNGTMNLFHEATFQSSTGWSLAGGGINIDNGFVDNPIPTPDIAAGTSTIAGALVTMFGGTINLVDTDGTLQFDANLTMTGGSFTNSGTVIFNGTTNITTAAGYAPTVSSAETVINGTMTITDAAGDFNWDGPGTATTTINGAGSLALTVDQVDTANDTYGGVLNLNDNADLTVNNTANSWTLANTLSKNNAGTSTVSGDRVVITGQVNANGGTLDMPAVTTTGSTTLAVAGILTLGGASELGGGAISGAGTLRMEGTSTVTANTTIGVATFDWDGLGTGTNHTINDGIVFTINSATLDSDGDMDDPINLGGNGTQLVVNGPAQWTATAAINANNVGAGTATIGGTSRLILTGANADLNVNGNTNITAPLTFGASSSASIDAGFTLDATNVVTYDGASILGAGTYNPGTTNTVTVQGAQITSTVFDFDGGSWAVEPGGLLDIDVTDYDTTATNVFDGTITLHGGIVDVTTGDAEFIMDGTLNMQSEPGHLASWDGEPVDIGNDAGALDADINVTGVVGTGTTSFVTSVDFNSDADVNVVAGRTLLFATSSTVNFDTVNGANNAEFTGAGAIAFNGAVNVNEAVTLNMVGGSVDLDGTDPVGEFINIDAPLTINAATLSSFGNVNLGGVNTLDVNNSVGTGVLTVTLDDPAAEWTLNGPGAMNLVNDNAEATLLAGSDLNVNGAINVTGDVRTTARLDIAGVVNINTAGQPFRLAGGNAGPDVNTIGGATITGLGLLGADAAKALHGFGTINADIDFDDTASLRAAGGTLNLTGDIVDVNILGTADNAGVLNILGPWETDGGAGGSIGAVVLAGGILQGGLITNDNLNGIQGNGTVTARVINSSKLVATNGGTLVVQTSGNDNDWDGAGNVGDLEALSADLEMVDTTGPVPPVRSFGGSVRAINNHRVYANGFGLDFNPGSSLTLEDTATYRASSSTDLGGTVTTTAGANATIEVANNFFLTFESTNVTTLGGNLTLKNNNINIEDGATFSGSGALKIPDGSHLVVDNNADVGVLLEMRGAFRPGNFNGIGRVNLTDYQQFDTGELYVEMIGTGLNQFDRLTATGDVIVDGYLNIDIDEIAPMVPFVPVLGNTFNIITSSISVSGQFDYYDVSGMPAGLAFKINYLPNAVQLQVVNKPIFSADFDDDGDVDPTDLQIWKGAYHLNQLGDADGDNDSDGADFLLWQRQAGSHPVVAATQAVPEPSAAALAAAAGLFLTALARRRRELGIDCV
jgi:hypothetical protein